MYSHELQKKWEEGVKALTDIELPDSLEWADQNIPRARKYIEETYSEAMKSIVLGLKGEFEIALEKYTKAWLRLWQHMAVEHFKDNDIMDVDMRYYRHLPDGYSMTWNSSVLGKKLVVFPRKPESPPDSLWITAGELVKMHENPQLFSIIKKFDGWFDRDEKSRVQSMMERALEDEKRNPPEKKLKSHRRDKHGVEWFK